MGWATTVEPVVGLLSCSGSCADATLSKRAAIRAMGDFPKRYIDIWLTAPSLGLALGNKVAVNASIQDFNTSFSSIMAVEGCRTACATQLLTSMGFAAAATVVISDGQRSDETIGVTAEQDLEIERQVPEVVQRIVDLTPAN